MALGSTSTIDEAWAQYHDNASYLSDSSVAKANLFIEAIVWLLGKLPDRVRHGGRGEEEIKTQIAELMELLKMAIKWRDAQSDDAGTDLLEFSEYVS